MKHWVKQSFAWISILSVFYVYAEQVLGEHFAGIENFSFFAFCTISIYYFNIKFLFPTYLGFKERFYIKMLLFLFLEFILLTVIIVVFSVLIGGLTIQIKGWNLYFLISNFFHTGFLFLHGLSLSGLSYLFYWNLNQTETLKEKKEGLRVLRRESEINRQNWLKAQLDPHLLYNVLPLLQYTVEYETTKASEVLIILNNMMRYYISNANDGLIPLTDEIEQARNYIALQLIQHGNQVEIDVEISGRIDTVFIPPMTVVLLVENIFKYGVVSDVLYPVTVRVQATDHSVFILTKNKRNKNVVSNATKIGIENLKERLIYFYPQSHNFTIVNTPAEYSVHLTLEKN